MALEVLAREKVWLDKARYADAERVYYEKLTKNNVGKCATGKSHVTPKSNAGCEIPVKKMVLAEIEKARQFLQDKVLNVGENKSSVVSSIDSQLSAKNNAITDLLVEFRKLEFRVSVLEGNKPTCSASCSDSLPLSGDLEELKNELKQFNVRVSKLENKKTAPAPALPEKKESSKKAEEDDDDVDLFGSESEEESDEAAKLKAQRVAEYAARKSKKPTLVAKSNIILDVKPWDDETDMKELEKAVRQVATEGLLWGASKLVPLAYGIHKLQISCVVEDEKVSIDWLQETLQQIEDFVQSVDIAAFNKI